MKLGLFLMPTHPPERSLYDGAQWDLQLLKWADELGFDEAWIGEHFTNPWEPCPAPDLLIAQALRETSRIKLAPGAHLLPYHHPAELACRVAYLDHLAQGRLMLGVGAGGLPSDWMLFNVDGRGGQNREMMWEALDIMLRLWADIGPFDYEGKYWTVHQPDVMFETLRPHLRPYQAPHPPIGVAAFSAKSDTLKQAGARGFLPMSLNLNIQHIAGQWEAVEEGAASVGRPADRTLWRIARDVFVAETDEEAVRQAVLGPLGRMYEECWLPLYRRFGWIEFLKHSPDVADSDVTPEYLARHTWITGAPGTVVQKVEELWQRTGGFGAMLVVTSDYADSPEPWRNSMRLLAQEVWPLVRQKSHTPLVEGTR